MDAARQILRFSIPGSIFLLNTVALIVIGRLVQHDSFDTVSTSLHDNVSAVVAIVAVVPVGFVVYQIYHVFNRPHVMSPPPWRHAWVRLDRGSQVLQALSDDQRDALGEVFGVQLDLSKPHGRASDVGRLARMLALTPAYVSAFPDHASARDAYAERWYRNWDVLRAVVEVTDGKTETAGIKREFTSLSDIYHSLGACRTAVLLAWSASTLASFLYVADGQGDWLLAVATAAIGVLVSAPLVGVLHQTRRQTWKSAHSALTFGLLWLLNNHPDIFDSEAVASSQNGIRSRLRNAVRSD